MQPQYFYDVSGTIKLLKPEGYGFIVSDKPMSTSDKDIFFHAASMRDQDIDFSELKVGQKVRIATVIVNRKGFQAEDITLVRPNSRSRSARV